MQSLFLPPGCWLKERSSWIPDSGLSKQRPLCEAAFSNWRKGAMWPSSGLECHWFLETSCPLIQNLAKVAALMPHSMAVLKIPPQGTQTRVTVYAGRGVPEPSQLFILCALAAFRHGSLFPGLSAREKQAQDSRIPGVGIIPTEILFQRRSTGQATRWEMLPVSRRHSGLLISHVAFKSHLGLHSLILLF